MAHTDLLARGRSAERLETVGAGLPWVYLLDTQRWPSGGRLHLIDAIPRLSIFQEMGATIVLSG